MLARSARVTPWVRAGLATLTGGADQHLVAAGLYGEIGNVTDRMLSLAAAARALVASGEQERATPIVAEVTEFAQRNQAVRLLDGLH